MEKNRSRSGRARKPCGRTPRRAPGAVARIGLRGWTLACIASIGLLSPGLLSPAPLAAQESHVLVVEGLAGNPAMGERFQRWATRLVDASVDRFGLLPENVTYLAPDPGVDAERIDGEARAENVEGAIERIRRSMEDGDRLLVVLIGHGTWDGEESRFALPGPDLTASDFADLLQGFPEGSLALVNTASASGAFLPVLSEPGRVVVTATSTGRERNATEFGRFFTEALTGDGADVDQDGTVSLLEAFTYARTEVERHYEEQNLLLTEHALLDDSGDGEGSDSPSREAEDGSLAASFVLEPSPSALAEGDPELQALYEERLALEEEVRDLNARSDQLEPEEYQASLESLLLELAELNQRIEEMEGGNP